MHIYIYISTMYRYIYIYYAYIYIYTYMYIGTPIVKTNYFSQLVSAVAVLKGYVEFVIYKC